MTEKVTLAQRLRAIASDVEQGAQEGPARMLRQVAAVLDREVGALEELKKAATTWRYSHGGSREEYRAKADMVKALDRLESLEAQR